ncbi:hypothetical protein ABZ916_23910 [Streptomyces sp. NPDC046853]|uniref:hypothetical protein n=1 Tax=Streptomyces sp. NPDC046853 TaxID=3154920 RepID=UPI0033F76A41
MGAEHELKDQARQHARTLLAQSTSFLALPFDQQRDLYREVYQASYDRLARRRYTQLPPTASGDGLVRQTAVDPRRRRGGNQRNQSGYNPNDPTDPANFENRRIEQAGQLAGEFIESIDFPGFVRDLTLAVFRGNLEVQHQQTDDFIRLLKMASASLGDFVRKVDDFDAYSKLAESEPDRFQLALPAVPDEDEDEGGDEDAAERTGQAGGPALLDRNGSPVDVTSGEIKAKILDTKIAMAQENRALLREVLLMGITRMVIKKGRIEAACVFDIKAKEKVTRQGMVQSEEVDTGGTTASGGIFGLFSGGGSSTHRETEISVSSAAGRSSTDLTAKITGSVSLEIESDYFKLDNFADMYRQISTPPPAPGVPPGAPAPAGPAAPPVAAP